MTYNFNDIITMPTTDTIFNASNGSGYFKYNQLHMIDEVNHYVYKFEMDAWFMRNKTTMIDVYIGVGAHPTLNLNDLVVTDETYWSEIIYENKTEEQKA